MDVIVVTAASDRDSIQKALQYGAVDYLIKPFEFDRLNASLTAYRDRVVLMRQRTVLSQAELDRSILQKEQSPQAELPKGLDRKTLKFVWEKVSAPGTAVFTTEDMARNAGISRVSMRSTLIFWRSLGRLALR